MKRKLKRRLQSVSGTICPLAQLYDKHFSEYEEPSGWQEQVDKVLEQYRATKSRQQMYRLIADTTNKPSEAIPVVNECLSAAYSLIQLPLMIRQQQSNIPSIGMSEAIYHRGD